MSCVAFMDAGNNARRESLFATLTLAHMLVALAERGHNTTDSFRRLTSAQKTLTPATTIKVAKRAALLGLLMLLVLR